MSCLDHCSLQGAWLISSFPLSPTPVQRFHIGHHFLDHPVYTSFTTTPGQNSSACFDVIKALITTQKQFYFLSLDSYTLVLQQAGAFSNYSLPCTVAHSKHSVHIYLHQRMNQQALTELILHLWKPTLIHLGRVFLCCWSSRPWTGAFAVSSRDIRVSD